MSFDLHILPPQMGHECYAFIYIEKCTYIQIYIQIYTCHMFIICLFSFLTCKQKQIQMKWSRLFRASVYMLSFDHYICDWWNAMGSTETGTLSPLIRQSSVLDSITSICFLYLMTQSFFSLLLHFLCTSWKHVAYKLFHQS